MKKPLIILHNDSLNGSPQSNNALSQLQEFVDQTWEREKKKFQEETGYIIQPTDSLEKLMKLCQAKGLTHHMFFHLMVIKSTISKQH
ncbi:hypothetical protein H9Q13_16770 [Pontibacter sp. JH31]|uniref:Uncharacterized protein n=1 Tax=Pontibacter aquaedesilientis TaxID=2766980 RepID=A0ABR7XKK1_9BACT|nr:hypothetical protein [Pontibacter aquaedesilientis]MBD1398827.1 hypothetical protein [Pontibacter aquaedesilientis]